MQDTLLMKVYKTRTLYHMIKVYFQYCPLVNKKFLMEIRDYGITKLTLFARLKFD